MDRWHHYHYYKLCSEWTPKVADENRTCYKREGELSRKTILNKRLEIARARYILFQYIWDYEEENWEMGIYYLNRGDEILSKYGLDELTTYISYPRMLDIYRSFSDER